METEEEFVLQLDGISLYACASELQRSLQGGRIERIAQPSRQTVVLTIRAQGHNHRLLLSCEPESPRAHLIETAEKGPEKPFTFLMILRKHLVHARIVEINAPRCDRILQIVCDALDDLDSRVRLTLIAELMGKHSNLILVGPNGVILDCAKRIPPSVSSLRTVLPGDRYEAPPVQHKQDLLSASFDSLEAALHHPEATALSDALVSGFYGISPYAARYLCRKAGYEADLHAPFPEDVCQSIASILLTLQKDLLTHSFTPCLLYRGGQKVEGVFPFLPNDGSEYRSMESMQAAMLAYYEAKRLEKSILRQRTQLTSLLQTRLQKLYKRLQIQQDTLAKSDAFERVRMEGELILAYAYQIPPHQAKIELYDYTQDAMVTLSYDPALSAQENAQKRFKRYQKLRSASQAAEMQIREIEPEHQYLEGVLFSVQQAETLDQLLDIRHELQEEGLIPPSQEAGRRRQTAQSQPLHFVSTDGIDMYCGRNNAQNDFVTLKLSKSTDTWLHAQGMPGSHVLIKSSNVPTETLKQAAQIAAFYSKGRRSENVPIDYTLIKYVRKPSGAKPGFVTYTSQKTLFITPEEALVKSLFAREDTK